MAEWYYIGHYGQLGPLTAEQVEELVEGGVILPDTYVWRTGMPQWQTADRVSELRATFQKVDVFAAPPPPPMPMSMPAPVATVHTSTMGRETSLAPAARFQSAPVYGGIRSDRSRVMGGVLQLLLPGIGRIYLGYFAYGALQLVLAICSVGLLWLWSFIDGLIILSGGLKMDGFGRTLGD